MTNVNRWNHLITLLGVLLLIVSTLSIAKTEGARLMGLSIKPELRCDALTLTFSKSTLIHYFMLSNPDRLVVDMQKVTQVLPLDKIALTHSRVQKIREGLNKHQYRLVFDLKQKPNKVTLSQTSQQPHQQFNFNLFFNASASKKEAESVTKSTTKASIAKAGPVAVKTQSHASSTRKIVIVIDPGHGGKDPGAIGHHGTYEKTIVLAVAKDIYTALKKEPGIQPVLTRYSDKFVPLRDRLKLTRQHTADLFISIHADAFHKPKSRGASIFALSQHGATSEAARWLAQKENYSELGGVDLTGKSQSLRSVLLDLSQTATIQESLNLGNAILPDLRRVARLHVGKVEQAPFMVLKAPDIPSVLIELGFISNRQEEKQLRSSMYQRRIANAIKDGIMLYLKQHPVQNAPIIKQGK